jgi:signal transduction histidine kinase
MSIYARIFLPFLAAVVVAASLAWGLATTLLADSLGGRLEAQLERAVAELAGGRLPLSADLLDRLGALVGAELLLIPRAGQASGPVADAAARMLARTPAGGAARFLAGDAPYSLVVRPIAANLDPRYQALAAATPLTEVEQTSERVGRRLGAASLAGIAVLAWVAHRTARRITDPLAAIGELAGRLATGDLQARSRIEGPHELVALGGAIDRMAERLERYQAAIAQRNRLSALGELAARVAHEIRNPLTAIKLHAELLAESVQAPADRQALATVLNEIRRLELVVADTLSLARAGTLSRTDTDLSALAGDVAALLAPQLAHRGIALECRLPPLAPARLDPDRIRQVLLNLLSNAADELPEGGRIRVTTAEEDGTTLLLTVEDSGPGLRPEGAAGRSGKPHGLGLGLAISREIAAQHGGRLHADASAALGGARFVLRLPRETGASPRPGDAAVPSEAGTVPVDEA